MEEEELKKEIEEMKDEFEIYTLPEYVVCSFEDKIKEIFQAGQLAEREKCLKMIEKVAKKVWNDVYREKIEVDDCLEILNIYTEKLTKKVKEDKQ